MATRKNKKKKHQFFTFLLGLWAFLPSVSLHGQQRFFDSTDFNLPPLLPLNQRGERGDWTVPQPPKKLTCPIPIDQGNTNYCLPFACIYGAFAIEKHGNKKWTPQQVTDSAYSAAYILHKMKSKIDISELNIKNLRESLKADGFCQAKNYRNSTNINLPPSWEADQEATLLRHKYKADTLVKIYRKDDAFKLTEKDLIDRFKGHLNNSKPIILGAFVETNFREKYIKKDWWQPHEVKVFHALLIVGYDDNLAAFEIMNSYGKDWGNGGFIKLSYRDLAEIAGYAYVLNEKQGKRGEENEEGTDVFAIIDSTQQDPIARFELYHKVKNRDENFEYVKQVVSYDTTRKMYETNADYWVNSTFQLIASKIPSNKKRYIFTVDSADNVQLFAPSDTINWTVQYGRNLDIVVLIADQTITGFSERLTVFKMTKDKVKRRLLAGFGNILTPKDQTTYMEGGDDIDVKAKRFLAPNQSVVPIILSIKMK